MRIVFFLHQPKSLNTDFADRWMNRRCIEIWCNLCCHVILDLDGHQVRPSDALITIGGNQAALKSVAIHVRTP